MKRISLARRIESLWYGRSAIAYLLLPFSLLFYFVISLRRTLYRSGVFHSEKPEVPVVVVGNIVVGGAGKTPVVVWVTAWLKQHGYNPGIISRGYGGSHHGAPLLVTSDADAAVAGDEPVVLARTTGCPVAVSPDRVAAANLLATRGCDVLISDDGLQHYRLRRDIEIAVVDGKLGLGNGFLLPAGPLREPQGRLKLVDIVVAKGSGTAQAAASFELVPDKVINLTDGRECILQDFAGKEVWAVAGIGNPESFYALLRVENIQVKAVDVPDHGVVELAGLLSAEPLPVLMTEKDAVKYSSESAADLWYVAIRTEFSADGAKALESVLQGLSDKT